MKKILIIDDSLIYRHALNSALTEEPSFIIAGTANNGKEGLDFILKNQLDLIILDIEMPIMNGFELIEKLSTLPSKPRIIVFTSLDDSGAENAMKALRMGADDFVTKVVGDGNINNSINDIKSVLIPKIKALLKIPDNPPGNYTKPITPVAKTPVATGGKSKKLKMKYEHILIGASTGGPEALRFLFKDLKGKKMPPILIVQHMPPLYTSYLAQTLSESTTYKVMEAKQGDIVKPGHCYIAPGDYHMTISTLKTVDLKISLNQEEKECFVRPSVNQLFRSAHDIKNNSLFLVLTGMGSDGVEGIQNLHNDPSNVDVLIQDEATSVVWGMPGDVYKTNLYTEMQSIARIKEILLKIIE